MPKPLKVFLCHAHSDKDTVKALYARLKREGVDVWLDKEKLLPGADWEYEIRKAVRESDVVIVCLSKQFNQAGFRQKEVRIALEEADKKPEGEIFIIPARLEECDNLESLSKWHWVDLFENDGFQRLILALRIRADKIGAALRQRGATISRQKKNAEQQDAEKAQRETAEKLKRGLAEREANEKIAREKAEREKVELAQAKQAEKERLEKQKLKPVLQPIHVLEKKQESTATPEPELDLLPLGVGGSVFIVLLTVIFVGNYLIKTLTSISSPTFIPTFGIGSTQVSNKDGMTLVFVPAAEFTMGSDAYSNEQPIHKVELDDFWIDQTEVTNAMYAKCVEESGCTPPRSSKSYTRDNYYGNSEFDDYPVINVDWKQANEYCSWAGRRLPTEAEWEKAARGTDGKTYPWGNESSDVNLLNNNSNVGDTTEVGKYQGGASIYGVLDMAGNVWEWVSSLYQPYPYDPNDGREDLTVSGSRVLRGGSWITVDLIVRSAFRLRGDPLGSSSYFGFRCSLSP